MAGLSRPAAGRLTWDGGGLDDGDADHGARLHYVGHADAAKAVLSSGENLAFWAGLRRPPGNVAQVGAALAHFGLSGLAGLPAGLLSAGQKRRLALARLLAEPAPLWLLDEPSVGLDGASATALEAAIAQHRREGGIVVLSTHTPIAVPDAALLHLDRFAGRSG
jgi:heme exporter protein A